MGTRRRLALALCTLAGMDRSPPSAGGLDETVRVD